MSGETVVLCYFVIFTVRIYGYKGRRGNNVNFKHQSYSRIKDCSGYRFRRKFKHSLFFYRCRDREFVADYSSWVYQRTCPLLRLNSVLYGLTLTLTIPRNVPKRKDSKVSRKLLQEYKDSYVFFSSDQRTETEDMEAVCCSCQLAIFSAAYGLNRIYPPHRSLAISFSKIMSGETVYTLLFSWQEYADIKAEEEIILILNTRVTAVSRTVQDIDSGENSSTVCFSFSVSL